MDGGARRTIVHRVARVRYNEQLTFQLHKYIGHLLIECYEQE